MTALLALVPAPIKIAAIAALAAGAAYYAGTWVGATKERQAIELAASKKALERVNDMVKNNANFLTLPDRDRCLVFMRDSGLPDSACD